MREKKKRDTERAKDREWQRGHVCINTIPSFVSNVFLLDASKRCSFFSQTPPDGNTMTERMSLECKKKKISLLQFLKNPVCMQEVYTKSQFTFHKRDKCMIKSRRDICAV